MSQKLILTLPIKNKAYLADHGFLSRTVLPATLALQLMAKEVERISGGLKTRNMRNVVFPKFMRTGKGDHTSAFLEVTSIEEGKAYAVSLSGKTETASGIMRAVEYARAEFVLEGFEEALKPTPCDVARSLIGNSLCFSAKTLYADLVPFGPAFHNAKGEIRLCVEGGIGEVYAPALPAPERPLGSIFPLDAAFHIACAHGQRYFGFVGFPAAISARRLLTPCAKRGRYKAVVRFTGRDKENLKYDIFIYAPEGSLAEFALGCQFADVSKGGLKPPVWIGERIKNPLNELAARASYFVLIELENIAPFLPEELFTPRELSCYLKFGEIRKKSFAASRIALKRISRLVSGDYETASTDLETLCEDLQMPSLGGKAAKSGLYISVSHNSKYVIVAASEEPIGIDVEKISGKALRGARLFLNESERRIVSVSSLGKERAATRAWSAKEAFSKAFQVGLAKSFKQCEVVEIRESKTLLCVASEELQVLHAEDEGHLFSLLQKPKSSVG